MRSTSRRLTALIAAVLLPVAMSGTALAAKSPSHRVFKGEHSVLTKAQVSRLSADATHHSIIIFKNQLSSLPARGVTEQRRVRAAKTAQSGVMSELTRLHAGNRKSYQIINAISATISSAEMTRLRANSAIRAVVPDGFRHFAPLGDGPGAANSAAGATARHGSSKAA